MSLWDDLPDSLRDSGALDGLRPVLENVASPTATEESDAEGTWRVLRTTLGGSTPLALDTRTGSFRPTSQDGTTVLEFPDPRVGVELALRLDGPGGSPDGGVRLTIATPSAVLRPPGLRGAYLDAQGQLRADPANPVVRFVLPALRVRLARPAGGPMSVQLLSAATGPAADQIFDFVRMDPPYALIGPGEVVGFAFRAAVLDLSGTAGPTGVPPEARAQPGDWQGLWLPEARLFVAPSGLEGLAVSAGVRDLWIGIGPHAGVTGLFEAEVVHRGAAPRVRLRFQTPTGAWIGVPDTDPIGTVDLPETVTLYADAGGGLAPFAISIDVDGVTTIADRVGVTVPATGTRTITVQVTDAGAHTTSRTMTVRRRPPSAAPAAPGGQPVQIRTTTTTPSRVVVVSQTTTTATVRLEPPGGTVAWSWPGGTATGDTAEIPVAAGATVAVTAVRSRPAASPVVLDCFMLFDRPTVSDPAAFATNPANTRTQPASDRTGWGSAPEFLGAENLARLAALPPGVTFTVDGYASYEGDDSAGQRTRNQRLSERRRDVLVAILEANGFAGRVNRGTGFGHARARDGVAFPGEPAAPAAGSSAWWRARATGTLPTAQDETVTADLTRPAAPPPAPDGDPTPSRPPVPDCFRRIGVRVELIRGTFVRAELFGEFDVRTAAEQRLAASTPAPPPPRLNPSDGICAFLVRLRVAEDRSSWDVTAELRAVEADLDGLARVQRGATGDQRAIDILGAVAALAPLLAAATPPSPTAGELVPMVVLAGAAVGIGASGVMQTRSVILRGGELVVSDGLVDPASGSGPRTTQVSVLLDVETAFTFDLGFIRVHPDHPVVTRYQAVGVRATWDTRPTPTGVEYVPLPVFDPSRGYTLDVPAGSLVAADPLGDILRVLGVRVSRDNPTYLEVEVGMGADLGIVRVDTVRVRLRLDAAEAPQLTKLGASLEVPGTLHGSGYVEITPFGFKGAFDLTVVPLNVRGSAVLAVETRNGVTGVLVALEIQFPVPIPLGNSGLGLFGFMGGVGVNYRRREPTGVSVPALRWLEGQFAKTPPNVMHPDGWEHHAGSYAFAAGILLGTAEGGFVVHLKGVVMIEVPGPRLLLVMKADVLKLPPALASTQSATFLAVLDIDFGRGTITLGVVAEYSIVNLLHIRVPVTAFFDARHPENWLVDLGTYAEPVTVTVLDVLSGTGYLMVHGNGLSIPALPMTGTGLTIAVGFHLRCVLMGSKAVGLYLEVAAGFDALVSFEPFAIGGRIYARGELRLFIVSIGASAELTVLVGRQRLPDGREVERTYVHGEVCGEIDLFFFTIRGCVSLTIGSTPPDAPVAPPLVAGVALVSRSPALVEGTATGRSVDGKLADAVVAGRPDPLPTVPLDAIPAVLFDVPPMVAAGPIVLGGTPRGSSGLPADPWIKRGDRWWRYELVAVELVGPLQPPAAPTPSTWWARGLPGDPQHGPALALLNWLPTPTPRAVPAGERLTTTVTDRWGRLCDPVADPAAVLWTWDGHPLGPSRPGWLLRGVPWPDAPGTYRSSPVDAPMRVTERWRCGDPVAETLQGTDPATVVGDAVVCPDARRAGRVTGLDAWQDEAALGFSRHGTHPGAALIHGVIERVAKGASLRDAHAQTVADGWDPELARHGLDCEGRVLRSPHGDAGEPAPEADDSDRELVAQVWQDRGFRPHELEDAISLHVATGLRALSVLLLVPEQALGRALVLRMSDRAGKPLRNQFVDGGDLVGTARPLPRRWTDPAGPWADPVERSGRIAARIAAGERVGLFLALVHLDLPDGVVTVDIGWDRKAVKAPAPAFYLVAMEGLVAAEAGRADWDTTTIDRERELLSTSLTRDPDDHALLVPGQTYTVRVRWRAQSVVQEAKPAANAPEDWGAEQTQEFRFAADPATEAPTDLAPWVLTTAPAMDEVGVLCREPVRIALAHQHVTTLFDAYGEELRVTVRAASGRHPAPPGGGPPGAPVTVPPGVGGLTRRASSALAVLTPWEEAARDLLDTLPCVPGAGEDSRHTVIEIPYDFEPLTDYLLDVEAVPRADPGAARRVLRVGFTTSRFATVADLAALVVGAPVEHRLVPVPAALAALGDRPTGDQLDAAYQAAGLAVPQVPRFPRVQVLWSPDPVPQPVAVVVESSEPLWRSRPVPTRVQGPVDAADPAHQWWAARPADWLFPAASVTPAAAGDPPRAAIARLVRGPGATRAVVLLGPGARGSEVRLDLVRAADALAGTPEQRTEAVRLVAARAPWEVDD